MKTKENLLDVLNCHDTIEKVIKYNVYTCPIVGKQYSGHIETKYFGVYNDMKVSHIAEIVAVINIESNDKGSASKIACWINDRNYLSLEGSDKIKDRAQELLNLHGTDRKDNRVFILENMVETNFINDSNAPFQRHNNVFDISSLNVKNSKELAEKLNGKSWSDFQTIPVKKLADCA